MATTVARLEAVLSADTRRFDDAMDRSDKKTSGFGSRLSGLAKTAGLAAGAAGIGAIALTLKAGISEWTESQKVAAQTEAVIKSTGGSAHVTAKEIGDLATALMKKSGIDDEAIQSGENMLLTFTNIRNEIGKGNDVFTQATGILTDMSVALGTDMRKQAIQLGKALNDPIKGVSALARVGVTFTAAQKEQIKAMVDSGHTMDAQKLILRELNKEFGGSAEALGKTLPGQINIVKESFNNWAGDLVGKMIPVLTNLGLWIRENWPQISATIRHAWETDIKPVLDAFISLTTQVVETIRANWPLIGPIVETAAKIIENTLGIVADILKGLAALLRGDWSEAWKNFRDAVAKQLDSIKLAVLAQVTVFKRLGEEIFGAVAGPIGKVLAKFEDMPGEIKNAVAGGTQKIAGAISGLFDTITTTFKNIPAEVKGAIGAAVNAIAGFADDAFAAAKRVGLAILNGIRAGLSDLGSIAGDVAGGIARAVKAAINVLIDRVNSALEFTIKMPGPIPDIHIDPPDIPHLAGGGIVTRPTLAMIGEAGPEAVVPLNRGGGQPIIVQLVADSQTLAEILIDPLRNQAQLVKQRTGRPAFG